MNKHQLNINDFRVAGENFLQNLITDLRGLQIPVDLLTSDHLCFRVATLEEYEYYKINLGIHGVLLTEAQVNGRPISTFKLDHPFKTKNHQVFLVELPAPKPGANYSTGFEHAEFLISECFDTFSSRFPQLSFIKSGNQTLNPELCLKVREGVQAKFHHLSLERVIELEGSVIKDIVFDLDGTLINSLQNIYEINRIVFSKILNREVDLQESIENFHPEFSKLFEAFSVSCSIQQREAIESWGQVSVEFTYHLFDGAFEILNQLKQQGFRLHLWTARDEFSARKILKHHELEELFLTCSFATSENSKPHHSSLRFDWSTAKKNQTILIGDSPADMIGAQNIKAIGGAALWCTPKKKNALISAGAELFFYNLSDLTSWLSPNSIN